MNNFPQFNLSLLLMLHRIWMGLFLCIRPFPSHYRARRRFVPTDGGPGRLNIRCLLEHSSVFPSAITARARTQSNVSICLTHSGHQCWSQELRQTKRQSYAFQHDAIRAMAYDARHRLRGWMVIRNQLHLTAPAREFLRNNYYPLKC